MKKIVATAASALCLLAAACNTGTTETGYESARRGDYVVSYAYSADRQTLTRAVADALSRRGWNAKSTPGGGFDASISRGGVSAKAKISISDNSVSFDSRGSTAAGEPIVPYRYLDYLNQSIAQYLRTRAE